MRVRCKACQKIFTAPDSAAGRIVKCPGCGGKMRLPAAATASPAINVDYEDYRAGPFDDFPASTSGRLTNDGRKPCPMCGEFIAAAAIRCRFCGENIGGQPRKRSTERKRGSSRFEKFRTQAIAIGGFWILCGLMNGVGAPLLLSFLEKQENIEIHGLIYALYIGVGIVFGVVGALACLRNLIALYAELVMSYLYILLNVAGILFRLAGKQGGSVCINFFWILVFIAVVIQSHRVIGWAHRYRD